LLGKEPLFGSNCATIVQPEFQPFVLRMHVHHQRQRRSALRIWPPKAGQTGHYKRRFSGLIRVGTSVLKPPSSNDLRHWVRVVPSRQAETRPSTSALVDAAEVASVMY